MESVKFLRYGDRREREGDVRAHLLVCLGLVRIEYGMCVEGRSLIIDGFV